MQSAKLRIAIDEHYIKWKSGWKRTLLLNIMFLDMLLADALLHIIARDFGVKLNVCGRVELVL